MGVYVTEGACMRAWRVYCMYVVLSSASATSVVVLVTEQQ